MAKRDPRIKSFIQSRIGRLREGIRTSPTKVDDALLNFAEGAIGAVKGTVRNIGLAGQTIATGAATAAENKRFQELIKSRDLAKLAVQTKDPEVKRSLLAESRELDRSRSFGRFAVPLAKSTAERRKKFGLEEIGLKTFARAAKPAIQTIGLGRAFTPTGALQLGATAGLGGLLGREEGETFLEAAGREVGDIGLTTMGLLPATEAIAQQAVGVLAPKAVGAAGQLIARGATGAVNVVEDAILSELDEIDFGIKDAALSFGIGALLSPTANERVVENIKNRFNLKPKQVNKVRKTFKQLRDERGRFESPDARAARQARQELEPRIKPQKSINDVRESLGMSRFGDEAAMGAFAGIEQDEEGNITFDPKKAATGMLVAGVVAPRVKKLTGKEPPKIKKRKVTKGKVKIGKQELNINRLGLSADEKKIVQALQEKLPKNVLRNVDVAELAKQMPVSPTARGSEQTAEVIAKQLNTRQEVVTLTKKLSDMKASGASKQKIEKLMLEIANKSRVSVRQGTDVARQLQARRILAEELATPMQRVFKMLDNAGVEPEQYAKEATNIDWNNAKQVTEFYRKFVPPKLKEVLDEIRYTNMLSSPLTHATNFASNLIQTAIQAPRKVLAGGYDWAISGLTGKERKRFAGEAVPFVKEALSSLPNATKSALEVIKGNAEITNLDLKRIPTGSRALELYTTPIRFLEAGDIFFKTILESGEKEALTLRAKRKGREALKTNIVKLAEKDALETLFRGEMYKEGQGWMLDSIDGLTSLITKSRNVKGLGSASKLMIPFVRTPMNILKQGVEYSPLQFLNMIKSRGDTADQLAKATIGSMTMAGAGLIAAGGNATWAAPTGTKERQEFYAAGRQPYSLKIGDKWVSYSKIGPLAYPMAMAAAVQHALNEAGPSEQNLVTAGKIVSMIGDFFTDQSYMQTVGDIIDALKGDEFKQTRLLASVPQQFVPYRAFQGWVARMVDPIYRKVNWKDGIPTAIAQSIQSQIPFASKNLPAYRDPFGEPSRRQFPLMSAISPVKITEERPLAEEIFQERQKAKILSKEERAIKEQFERESEDGAIASSDTERLQVYFKVRDAAKMPTDTAFEKTKRDKEIFGRLDDILDSEVIDDETKTEVIESLGISRSDADYWQIARMDSTIKLGFIDELIEETPDEDLIKTLTELRKEVNGKRILSNTMIDTLFKEGVITSTEKKFLKSITQDRKTGELKAKETGKAKLKEVSVPKVTVPQISRKQPTRISGLQEAVKTTRPTTLKRRQPITPRLAATLEEL